MDSIHANVPDGAHPDVVGTALPQFYVPSTASLQERRPRTLKHGDSFAVFDHNGDILSGAGSPEGLFHEDTRYLSHLSLTLGGERPMLLASNLRDDNASLTCDLANPDLRDGDRLILGADQLHVRRSKFLWQGTSFERVAVRSFADRPVTVDLAISFAADFADLFEVRGARRTRRGSLLPPQVAATRVSLSYSGLDGKVRTTVLTFDPVPATISSSLARWRLDLQPRGRAVIWLEVACGERPTSRAPREHFVAAMREARRALRASSSRAASVAGSNEVFNEAVRRSIADLYMLMTDKPGGAYPYAGIPWFSAVFGRDAIITAAETLWLDPEIARGVLNHLAANQASEDDAASDAEPGKILHEARGGEMAALGEVPFRRYYGSVDATPLFVWLAGAYLDRTGDVATVRSLWPNLKAALTWMDRYGDRDGDGFLEYGRRTRKGLLNQGWKDSHDSIFHADGSLAEGPIALCEVQAYAYGAKRAAAAISRALGDQAGANVLDAEADTLRQRFEQAFWCEDLGTYALALDGDKRPCRVRASNAGHALWMGIAAPDRAARVAQVLLGAGSFSGWGIRTLSTQELRYNPMSYHNGSVWPHDNALIAMGLSRYGLREEAARVFEGLFAAAAHEDLRRLPELFCGFARRRGRGPTAYPVACAPQAWAAAVPFALLQACIGLEFDPGSCTVRFDRPMLPTFLDEVILRGLRVGAASADVRLRRVGQEIALTSLARHGALKIVTTG